MVKFQNTFVGEKITFKSLLSLVYIMLSMICDINEIGHGFSFVHQKIINDFQTEVCLKCFEIDKIVIPWWNSN